MSGVGKSVALEELARRGFITVDTDYGEYIHLVDGEPLWRAEAIDALLSGPRAAPLFVQGTVANQGRFYDRFDAVVLLSAPIEVMLQRLATRTNNPFGTSAQDRAKVALDTAEVVPLLRAAATHEIDTSRPLDAVVEELIVIAEHAR